MKLTGTFTQKRVRLLVLCFIALAWKPDSVSGQAAFSFSRVSDSDADIVLRNDEPVAGIQFTVRSSSLTLLEASVGTRANGGGWLFSFNKLNDSTINVLLYASSGSLPRGEGPVIRVRVSTRGTGSGKLMLERIVVSDPAAKGLRAMADELEWLGKEGAAFALDQNFPNPFNPTTTIPYRIERDARVNLSIYDITGRVVATILDQQHRAGTYSALWNSTDDGGKLVSSGVYFVRLQVGSDVEARKIILTR